MALGGPVVNTPEDDPLPTVPRQSTTVVAAVALHDVSPHLRHFVLFVTDDSLVYAVRAAAEGVSLVLVCAAVHAVSADGLLGGRVTAALPALAVILSDAAATLRTLEDVGLRANARSEPSNDRQRADGSRLARSVQRKHRCTEGVDATTCKTVRPAGHMSNLLVVPVPVAAHSSPSALAVPDFESPVLTA